MKNIVLIGMPGAGKSTVGVILAKALGYQFVDSDLLIQKREERLLREIIAEEGIDGFLTIEDEVNAAIEDNASLVIATGGSAVYGERSMEHFYQTATVIYLKLAYEELCERVEDPKKRGVVLREGQSFYDLYQERCPLYEKYAHMTVDANGEELGELLEKIRNTMDNKKN